MCSCIIFNFMPPVVNVVHETSAEPPKRVVSVANGFWRKIL